MVSSRSNTRKNKNSKSKSKSRNQRGGNGWGFNGSAIAPRDGMAPIDLHSSYSTCTPPQRGGGCGCGLQLQRGGGSDGYYAYAADNALGKVPVYGMNPCVQRGGNAAQEYGVASYSAGYGFAPVQTGSAGAPFMATVPYGNSCMGGYRRTRNRSRSRNRKTKSKSRNNRKTKTSA